MTLQDAIEKAQKLLRLSKSDNAHEAATALKMAQNILTRFQISQDMLDDAGEEEEGIVDDRTTAIDFDSQFNLEMWRGRLAGIIARVNACKVYTMVTPDPETFSKMRKNIFIIGRPSDAAKVRYLYTYFMAEVQRLAKRDAKGQGKIWLNNFRHGVVDTVTEKLLESVEEMKNEMLLEGKKSGELARTEKALVKMDSRLGAVEKWIKENAKLKAARASYSNPNGVAREQGRVAGREINGATKARGALNG